MIAPRPIVCVAGLVVATLALAGCEVTVTEGSYTKQHCDAFEEARSMLDAAVGEEVLALSNPPAGGDVVPGVHDAAVQLSAALLGDAPESVQADLEDALLAECAKVSAEDLIG